MVSFSCECKSKPLTTVRNKHSIKISSLSPSPCAKHVSSISHLPEPNIAHHTFNRPLATSTPPPSRASPGFPFPFSPLLTAKGVHHFGCKFGVSMRRTALRTIPHSKVPCQLPMLDAFNVTRPWSHSRLLAAPFRPMALRHPSLAPLLCLVL